MTFCCEGKRLVGLFVRSLMPPADKQPGVTIEIAPLFVSEDAEVPKKKAMRASQTLIAAGASEVLTAIGSTFRGRDVLYRARHMEISE